MTSDHRKGSMPANITPVGTSRSMPLSTKTFMPTGGVMRLISVITTTRIPNQIKISPAARSPKSSRSEEHTSELQSLMRISYAVFCLKKKKKHNKQDKHD